MNTDQEQCLECDYNLTGLTSDRCPECGWHIDRKLLAYDQHRGRVWTAAEFFVVLAAVTGFVSSGAVLARVMSSGPGRSSVGYLLIVATAVVGGLHFLVVWRGMRRAFSSTRSVWFGLRYRWAGISQIAMAGVVVGADPGASPQGIFAWALVSTIFGAPGALLLLCSFMVPTSRRDWMRDLRTEWARQSTQLADGATFDVDAFGWFPPESLEVVFDGSPRKTNLEIETLIESTWKEKLREAQAGKCTLYNGSQGRLIKSEVLVNKDDASHRARRGNRLRLVLGTTCYRDFVGTNLYNVHLAQTYGLSCLANPLGTTAVIITADGYLLYGRRSHRVTFHAGYLHTFGGSLEAADQTAEGSFDVFGAIRRELYEELHLADGEIAELVCTGLVRDHQIMQPELLFDASVSITRDDLLARFDAETDPEHVAIETCHDEPEAIIPFIERAGKIAPVAVASIMLHGRFHWGRDWYEQASFILFGELPPERSARTP